MLGAAQAKVLRPATNVKLDLAASMACSEASVTGAEASSGTGAAAGGSAGPSVAAGNAGGASEGADGAEAGFIGVDVPGSTGGAASGCC
ncbi:hypothetical protein PI124_g21465 [Phytophthora idaei]|nr:hypothetical protein PI125_g20628 [Phytophthora idaei]KAG3122616.1 hypothetical protein PI126_g24075 [Phytophthora idaei]KAG3233459.1 hypothetical protein PI124_g21465 [Phytophthora idaei]